MFLTRPPRDASEDAPVRLACIRHAASVDPEPGSNSPPVRGSPSRPPDPVSRIHIAPPRLPAALPCLACSRAATSPQHRPVPERTRRHQLPARRAAVSTARSGPRLATSPGRACFVFRTRTRPAPIPPRPPASPLRSRRLSPPRASRFCQRPRQDGSPPPRFSVLTCLTCLVAPSTLPFQGHKVALVPEGSAIIASKIASVKGSSTSLLTTATWRLAGHRNKVRERTECSVGQELEHTIEPILVIAGSRVRRVPEVTS